MKKSILIAAIMLLISAGLGIAFQRQMQEDDGWQMRPASEPLEQRALKDPDNYPEIAHDLPEGFIALGKALDGLEKIISRTFVWHGFFDIRDSEGLTIFTTSEKNSDFIVIHGNALYVNEEEFSKIVERANEVYEQRNAVYSVGDAVEIRGHIAEADENGFRPLTQYDLSITNAKRVADSKGAAYEIKFTIDPMVEDGILIGFFDYALTRVGMKRGDFTLIDHETVRLEVGRFERIKMLALNVPDELLAYLDQDSPRRVRIC